MLSDQKPKAMPLTAPQPLWPRRPQPGPPRQPRQPHLKRSQARNIKRGVSERNPLMIIKITKTFSPKKSLFYLKSKKLYVLTFMAINFLERQCGHCNVQKVYFFSSFVHENMKKITFVKQNTKSIFQYCLGCPKTPFAAEIRIFWAIQDPSFNTSWSQELRTTFKRRL